MTFDYRDTGPADEVRTRVKNADKDVLPPSLREFILWGINGVKVRHTADTVVDVQATGYFDDGNDSDDFGITSVNLMVRSHVPLSEVPPPTPCEPLSRSMPAVCTGATLFNGSDPADVNATPETGYAAMDHTAEDLKTAPVEEDGAEVDPERNPAG